jgi:hypothetical protein
VLGTAAPDPNCADNGGTTTGGGVTAGWISQDGISYYIFVHGGYPNSMGDFELLAETDDIITLNQFCPHKPCL